MRRRVCLVLLLVFIGVSTSTVFGVDVDFVKEFPLVPNGVLEKVVDFCVTDDGIFLLPDFSAGDVKLYKEDEKGENLVFLEAVGSKGYGPGQFVKPAFCSFNKAENKFIIVDWGTRRIYLYDRFGRDEFVREKKDDGNEAYGECPRGAYDIQLSGNRLFVAGHKNSGDKFYDFYSTDLSEFKNSNVIKAKPEHLLPSGKIYQIDENDDFVQQIGAKDLEAIGYLNYFDIEGNFAYFVWMGDLRIIRVDISSDSKVVEDSFGEKTGNYVQPEATPELVDTFYQMVRNRESRDKKEFRDKYFRERRKFSISRALFTTSKHVILVYEGPYKYDGKSENFHVQFYSLDGQFVAEVPLPAQPDLRAQPDSIIHFFNRDNKALYTLSKSESGTYSILMYKISEQ